MCPSLLSFFFIRKVAFIRFFSSQLKHTVARIPLPASVELVFVLVDVFFDLLVISDSALAFALRRRLALSSVSNMSMFALFQSGE